MGDTIQLDENSSLSIAPKANAFRVLDDGNGIECILDFLLYSAKEDTATVISRVRVKKGFLPLIRDRLTLTLQEIRQTTGA